MDFLPVTELHEESALWYHPCAHPPPPGVQTDLDQGAWLCGHRRAKRSYSTFKVRRGGGEEIPLVQGKEQRLRFAGAAVKRYPKSKVRETQIRW